MIWKIKNNSISFNEPIVMGVLNITPDSFYDGGKYLDSERACAAAEKMKNDGADIIDIGGESSRPGAKPISESEELERVIPVIKKIAGRVEISISIDTYKVDVAEKALNSGAVIINDISGCEDSKMADLVKKSDAGIVIMHKHGSPETMQDNPIDAKTVMTEVMDFLKKRTDQLIEFGIKKEQIVIDPGIGFGKTFSANEKLIAELKKITALDFPVLIGASRKKFIGEIIKKNPNERLAGSLAAHVIAYLNGAKIIRTHDVAETRDALNVARKILNFKI